MRVPWSWLSEYVDLSNLSPEAVSEALTNAGLEVEEILTTGPVFSGVVLAKTTAVDPHPNADKLRLVTVETGQSVMQVVCGAPNVRPNSWIAYAAVGAQVINRKQGGLFTLTPAVIRGVESAGMICSLDELGLETQFAQEESGIWVMDAWGNPEHLGKDLKAVLNIPTETVLDVVPTANRGDQMSMIGVAREVAALFDRPLTLPEIPAFSVRGSSNVQIRLTSPEVCPFYAGAELQGVSTAASPAWMQQRLDAAGMRAINLPVDITNYVMLETGQPLHAFDRQTLGESASIDVRAAQAGEHLKTLDDQQRDLTPTAVVVTSNQTPVALAGVMGGAATEITENTQTVYLEAAYFVPAPNRRSARSVGIRTESSARFERGVDPFGVEAAMMRALSLFESLAGATCLSLSADDHRQATPVTIPLRLAQFPKVIGMSVDRTQIESSLQKLGFSLSPTAEGWTVTSPSFRIPDVTREIDLIEEAIRIIGYDQVPYTLPQETALAEETPRRQILRTVQQTLLGLGLTEVSTVSLIGPALLERFGLTPDLETTVEVTNSHSRDHTLLRQSLLPTLLDVTKHNLDNGNEVVWIAELGKGYFKTGTASEKASGIQETLFLCGVLTGMPQTGQWHQAPETDFFTVKGVVEQVLQRLGLSNALKWHPMTGEQAQWHPGQTAQLTQGKAVLGTVGRLHPALAQRLKFRQPVYAFELNLDALLPSVLKKWQKVTVNEALSAYPAVSRDIALAAPLDLSYAAIVEAIEKAKQPLIQHIALFDEYRGEHLGPSQRSLAFRLTLQSTANTLTDVEIEQCIQAVKNHLTKHLPVTLR